MERVSGRGPNGPQKDPGYRTKPLERRDSRLPARTAILLADAMFRICCGVDPSTRNLTLYSEYDKVWANFLSIWPRTPCPSPMDSQIIECGYRPCHPSRSGRAVPVGLFPWTALIPIGFFKLSAVRTRVKACSTDDPDSNSLVHAIAARYEIGNLASGSPGTCSGQHQGPDAVPDR